MKIRILVVVLLLAVSATSALAAGPYFGVAGGVSILHDGDITVNNGIYGTSTATAEYDAGFGINTSVGYNFEPARLEFEFGYKQADMNSLSAVRSVSVSNVEVSVMSFMVNGYYDIKNDSPITPYIGAGLGLLYGEMDDNGYTNDDTEFGYQLIVGAAYNFNKNVTLDISYRFQSAPSDFSQNGGTMQYNSSNIMAGLRFSF